MKTFFDFKQLTLCNYYKIKYDFFYFKIVFTYKKLQKDKSREKFPTFKYTKIKIYVYMCGRIHEKYLIYFI